MFASTIPTTASADIISASTFGPANPEPVPDKSARVVSQDTNTVAGFLPNQDRVSITQQARDRANAELVQNNQSQNTQNTNQSNNQSGEEEAPSDEFIQVSSSIGRAAQTGNLSRQEAMAIYQKIASLI